MTTNFQHTICTAPPKQETEEAAGAPEIDVDAAFGKLEGLSLDSMPGAVDVVIYGSALLAVAGLFFLLRRMVLGPDRRQNPHGTKPVREQPRPDDTQARLAKGQVVLDDGLSDAPAPTGWAIRKIDEHMHPSDPREDPDARYGDALYDDGLEDVAEDDGMEPPLAYRQAKTATKPIELPEDPRHPEASRPSAPPPASAAPEREEPSPAPEPEAEGAPKPGPAVRRTRSEPEDDLPGIDPATLNGRPGWIPRKIFPTAPEGGDAADDGGGSAGPGGERQQPRFSRRKTPPR